MTALAPASPADNLDSVDRRIVNALQDGFPICDRPFAAAAENLGIAEDALMRRIQRLLDDGLLTRFGPLYDPVALGGAVTLAAMTVPEDRFDAVAEIVNAFPEVAHNYARAHLLNMWFVVAAEDEATVADTLRRIREATGLPVLSFPKECEYALDLRLEV